VYKNIAIGERGGGGAHTTAPLHTNSNLRQKYGGMTGNRPYQAGHNTQCDWFTACCSNSDKIWFLNIFLR